MSKEWMFKTLEKLGLKRLDAEVYVYLVQNEPQGVKAIAEALEKYERRLYRSLRNLKLKGMVRASKDHPAQFSAVSLDKVLDFYIKTDKEEAKRIEENKEKILSLWRSVVNADS